MLNRLETRMMGYLFARCRGKRTMLIAPEEILTSISLGKGDKPLRRYEITKKQLDTHMKNLVLDGYIDYSATNDKESKTMYVITLTTRGEAFQRERDEYVKRRLQEFGWRMLFAVCAAIIGIIVGYLFRR